MQIQANNVWINYEQSGTGDTVVMLSHSLGSNLYMWDPQMAALEAEYQVLRYDTRGHGGSGVDTGAFSLDDLADDAVALMDALNIDKVHWLGLSMGGMIGQSLGLRHRDRLLSLTLCDTMAVLPAGAAGLWQERINTAREKGMEALVQATMERWFTPAYLEQEPPGVKLVRQYFLATPVEGYAGSCSAIMKLNYLERLNTIETPTLIIVGAEDMGTPVAASEAMHERIAGSRLVVIPSASHFSNVEQSEAFNKAVLDFLRAR